MTFKKRLLKHKDCQMRLNPLPVGISLLHPALRMEKGERYEKNL